MLPLRGIPVSSEPPPKCSASASPTSAEVLLCMGHAAALGRDKRATTAHWQQHQQQQSEHWLEEHELPAAMHEQTLSSSGHIRLDQEMTRLS